jgi:predicted NAD/FAD-dependent oxidoreductase
MEERNGLVIIKGASEVEKSGSYQGKQKKGKGGEVQSRANKDVDWLTRSNINIGHCVVQPIHILLSREQVATEDDKYLDSDNITLLHVEI